MRPNTYHATERARPTLRDIAERVGVSVNTASFVLNGSRSGTRVSSETRQAIWQVAEELGYSPNALARSLRSQRTHSIGLFSNFEFLQARNLFLSELVGGLQEGCAEGGLDLLLHSFGAGSTVESLRDALTNRRVDGLIYYAPSNPELGRLLAKGPAPVVSVVDAIEALPSVCVDDVKGGQLQARYLANLGHRKVLYRAFHQPPVSAIRREKAFKREAEALGLKVFDATPFGRIQEHRFDSGEIALLRSEVTAVVCWEDNSAHGTAAELTKLGFRVPGDIEVVGFNGLRTEQPLRWNLTTVEAPWREVARTAIQILKDLIAGKDVEWETTLPVRLVLGDTSTDTPLE